MEKALAVQATAIDFSNQKMLDTIRATVAQKAMDEEFAMFVELCKATGLNPFKKKIWFVKPDNRPPQILTGINGFFQIANKHPQYDGMQEPEFEFDKNGLPISCRVRVWRKDRTHPSTGVAWLSEFKKSSPTWSAMPRHMLAKVAKAIALREAFPQELNGLYTDDEYDGDFTSPPHPLDSIPVKVTVQPENKRPSETAKQAETRALMADGKTWTYGAGYIEVEGPEKKALWARLVKDHGAITDAEGIIHTSSEAKEIADALITRPTETAKVVNAEVAA